MDSTATAYSTDNCDEIDITSILAELEALRGPMGRTETERVLRRIAACPAQLRALESFDTKVYRRNSFFKNEFVELLLLCWRPGQLTPIHDHAGSTCGVYVVRGHGTEVSFEKSGLDILLPTGRKELNVGEITTAYDEEVHLLGNFCSPAQDLVTLHCYSPPLKQMKVYPQADTFFANYENLREDCSKSGKNEIRL